MLLAYNIIRDKVCFYLQCLMFVELSANVAAIVYDDIIVSLKYVLN